MPLPKISAPIFDLKLPLSKKLIKYRPFLVKEEKILLIAQESNDEKTIINAIKQIVQNCVLNKLDINKLPVTDLEFLFLNLRARSIGELIDLQYKCNNDVIDENGESKKCNNIMPIQINILDVTAKVPSNHDNKIDLGNDIGIVMTYPNFNTIENINMESKIDSIMGIVSDCVDYIYDKDQIYYKKDISKKELDEFIESLSKDQFNKIQTFFETAPKLKHEINFECNKCGYKSEITLEGLQSFFG